MPLRFVERGRQRILQQLWVQHRSARYGEMYNTATLTDFPELRVAHEDNVPEPMDVKAFLQAAMDEAWAIGLRPLGHADATQELAPVRYHLEDMRKLAKVKT